MVHICLVGIHRFDYKAVELKNHFAHIYKL